MALFFSVSGSLVCLETFYVVFWFRERGCDLLKALKIGNSRTSITALLTFLIWIGKLFEGFIVGLVEICVKWHGLSLWFFRESMQSNDTSEEGKF